MPNPLSNIKKLIKKDENKQQDAKSYSDTNSTDKPSESVNEKTKTQLEQGAIDAQKRAGIDVLTRLTQRSNLAVMAGVNKAKELKVQYIDTEHILWGLLADSGIFELISELKVTPGEIQKDLEALFKKENFNDNPQFSPRIKRALELSLSAARSLGYEFISPEHILLALSQEGEGAASKILAKHGLNVEVLNKQITGKEKTEKGEKGEEGGSREKGGGSSSINQFTHDLTAAAREGKLDPVVARASEIERVTHILSRRTKNNPVLIGEAGVGKTAIVEGLAQRIAQGNVPETLKNKRVLSVDLMSVIAGASHRGEFEERLKNLIREVKAAGGEIILFIDEIHNMVGAGGGGGSSMDASNILKPSLARGELQTIGATTITEYRKYMEKDRALERRFQPIMVEEPTPEQALEMLTALRDKYEAFHKVSIPDDSLKAAVSLSNRYIGDRYLPDKAVDLIDEAASSVRLPAISLPEEINSLQVRIKRLAEEKLDAQKNQDDVRAAAVERQVESINKELEEKKKAYEIKKSTTTNSVTPREIEEIVSKWTNIPISRLTESESAKLLSLEDLLHERLINQKHAVDAVSEAVRRGRAGLKSTKRPIGSFIFMGPTGVGKTELAKALAQILFGSEEKMVRLDMTEYMEKHEVAKLIGAPPGYVGYEEGGQLTEAVRRQPYSVVLMDEVEKAHADVFNILLQILDDGRLTDNKGRTIDFKNTILIATSNIGTGLIQKEMLVEGAADFSTQPLSTLAFSPTGRTLLTLKDRIWQKDKEGESWKTGKLEDYFEGQEVEGADLLELKQKFPAEGLDTHAITPSGEELATSGGRVWKRKSTTSKKWDALSLIEYFKAQEVANAQADEPDQQLPTVKLSTLAVSPSETMIVTFKDRYWIKNNLSSNKWETGTIKDYLEASTVAEDAQSSPLPASGWSEHLFTPEGAEIIIKGNRFWKREKFTDKIWTSNELTLLFSTARVENADPLDLAQQLPIGQEVDKAKKAKDAQEESKFAQLKDKLLNELRKFFRPELLNRFDDTLVFRPLGHDDLLKIVDLQFADVAKLLEEQNIGFEATEAAKKEVAVEGYDPIFGARPLRRTIQRMVENPISSMIIKGELKAQDTVSVDFDGNDFIFTAKVHADIIKKETDVEKPEEEKKEDTATQPDEFNKLNEPDESTELDKPDDEPAAIAEPSVSPPSDNLNEPAEPSADNQQTADDNSQPTAGSLPPTPITPWN